MTYGCYYVTIGQQVFGLMSALPIAIATFLTIASLLTSEVIFFFFGWYLFALKWVIWCLQSYFLLDKPVPVCPEEHIIVFPSIILVMTSSAVVFSMCYVIWWHGRIGFIGTMFWWSLFLIPPAYLYIYDYNNGWQIVLSMTIGALPTLAFAWFLQHLVQPCLPVLLTCFPLWHLGYKNTFLVDPLEDNIKQL